jgi:hypothetical protein
MTTLTLSPMLANVLQIEAEKTDKSVAELAEEWLRQQYASLQRQRLAEQTRHFFSKQVELYAQYPNQFVAFYDDNVLDYDEDMRTLALRIRAAYGDLPIVIAQVTASPIRGYRVISARATNFSQ